MKNFLSRFKKWITKYDYAIIILFSIVLSLAFFFYYYEQGLIVAYGDSRGHLNIARRVVESPTPGLAQLGGYWLPLLHLLMLPTVWNDFFWQTGISGSIVNMISYVVTNVAIYALVLSITKKRIAAFIATGVVMFNWNFLYMQVTPMTEVLFVATVTLSIYFFYKWIEKKYLPFLIFSSIFVSLSSLNRYEGWALALIMGFILFIDYLANKFSKKSEGTLIIFSVIAFSGIILWLVWGLVIFNDPLEFLHNDLSAGRQTQTEFDRTQVTGYFNIVDSILTNIYSIRHTSGWLLVILAGIGLSYYIFKNYRSLLGKEKLFLLALFAPFLFDVFTVFIGNVPVEVPELSKIAEPGDKFNIRYSLYSLPLIAVLIGILCRKAIVSALITLIIIFNYFLLLPLNNKKLITLDDVGARSINANRDLVHWFKSNYAYEGLVLVSTGSGDGFMHETGIHLKNFITEGAYRYWDESMENPGKHAEWVILSSHNKRDQVNQKINKERLQADFEEKYERNGVLVYKKKYND